VIDASFFHGFPYTDIGATGASVVVVTDNDPTLAHQIATEIASAVWDRRDEFIVESLQPEVTIELAIQALATAGGPVIINDTADNPGGGTPGDGTHLLAAMIEADVEGSCFGFVFDPVTADAAHAAGVGATVDVRIGGRHGPLHGEPVEATAYVKTLTDGRIVYSSPMVAGVRASLGKSARLTIGKVDVIVTSRRNQTFDPGIFLLHGIDVTTRSIVGLKSSQHFRAGFRDLATRIITADSPGLTTLDVNVFDHPAADGPLWPLDPKLEWVPSSPVNNVRS
jgi:microcystin degradation protein MlrC